MSAGIKPQTRLILGLLRRHPEGVTPMMALYESGCFRLAPRVWELTHLHGYRVDSELVTRDGVRFAVYRIVEQPEQLVVGL